MSTPENGASARQRAKGLQINSGNERISGIFA